MALNVKPLTGPNLAGAVPALARLRIEVFRAWPYLYDGTAEYEQKYLAGFAAAERSLVVAALDGDEIVGAATASPITGHMPEFAEPLQRAGHDLVRVFYFGESVLRPEYRGRGLGHAFFDAREAHARSFGGYRQATFCAVARAADHPLMDPAYRPLDDFWRKRGYRPLPGLLAQFEWKDIDKAAPDLKPMQYWLKDL